MMALLLFGSCTKDSGPIILVPEPIIDTVFPDPPVDTPHVYTAVQPVKFPFHPTDTVNPPGNDTVSFANDLMPVIQARCYFCHPPSGDLDLSNSEAYNQLVNVVSDGFAPAMRVVPFDTVASVLYHKIVDNGVFGLVMPPYGIPLTATEKANMNKWIMQGALDN